MRGELPGGLSTVYPEIAASERLTVPQTLGLAFLPSDNPSVELFSRANPDARDFLYRIARKRDPELNHFAWELIGHVGDENDVREIRTVIESDYREDVTPKQYMDFGQIMTALGILAVRRVPTARKYLLEMADCDYWHKRELRVSPRDVIEAQPYLKYGGALAAIGKLAWVDKSDVPGLLTRFANQCGDRSIEPGFRITEMLDGMRILAALELKRICRKSDSSDLTLVSSLFDGNYDNPGHNWKKLGDELVAEANARERLRIPHDQQRIRDLEDPALKELLAESEIAVDEIYDLFRKGDAEAIRPRVMKDGSHHLRGNEPLYPAKIDAVVKRLDALFRIETRPADVDVTTWKVWSDKANAEITNARISYRLEGTQALGEELRKKPVPDAAPGYTVDKDGALKVVMQREGGVWRWNPFGW